MQGNLGLLGAAGGGGGGGASSGGSTSGFGSTLSKEDNLVLASEESSSYPDESDIELGLGLSLGGGRFKSKAVPWSQYGRILTAEDLPSSMASKSSAKSTPPSSSSSSSSSSSMTKASFSAGTKRTADSISPSPANRGVSQVVGWPPIGAYRMNSFANQAKLPASEEFHSAIKQTKSKNGVVDMSNSGVHKNNSSVEDKGKLKTSLFVKVNKDGIAIGRKVDLSAYSCYEKLAQTLEDMFCRSTATVGVRQPSMEEHSVKTKATGPLSKLLDGSSEFVLTYEDKDGDWMLVGDVPWGMFISSVKRLRIMRTAEANGLGARFQGRNGGQSKPA